MNSWLATIEKEPDERKAKGVDLNNWLESEENIKDIRVYAYLIQSQPIATFDLSDIQYITFTGLDENYEKVQSQEEWKMSDQWDTAKLLIENPIEQTEVTKDLIVSETTGYDNPNRWVEEFDNNNKYRVMIENGTNGNDYRIELQFSTDAGRTEEIHWKVKVREIRTQ